MMAKAYFYFIRSKYTKESTREELVTLKDLFAKCFELGLCVGSLSDLKKSAIENGTIGRELTKEERAHDNWVMNTPWVVRSFLQIEFEKEEESLDELQESIERIRQSILNNLSIEAREKFLAN